jgi:hypothetical protein
MRSLSSSRFSRRLLSNSRAATQLEHVAKNLLPRTPGLHTASSEHPEDGTATRRVKGAHDEDFGVQHDASMRESGLWCRLSPSLVCLFGADAASCRQEQRMRQGSQIKLRYSSPKEMALRRPRASGRCSRQAQRRPARQPEVLRSFVPFGAKPLRRPSNGRDQASCDDRQRVRDACDKNAFVRH